MLIYKILTADQWADFQKLGSFEGAPVDLADGFIHFSTAAQLRQTAAKHFAAQDGLVLVWTEADNFGADLKWEISRGGAEFPHLFASWSLETVSGHCIMPLVKGVHQFPAEIA